jgi:hypothetical protein
MELPESQIGPIYFRTRVDRLYERLDAPGHFIHVDYKSSRHAKSESEVHDDKQLWAYNFGICTSTGPRSSDLVQLYDQLATARCRRRRTATAARADARVAHRAGATAVIEDEDWQADGLLEPKKNQWCAWCPIMESCPTSPQLTEFALLEIETLAPTVKEGRKTVVELDPGLLPEYLYRFENAQEAVKILERFDREGHEVATRSAPCRRAGAPGLGPRPR